MRWSGQLTTLTPCRYREPITRSCWSKRTKQVGQIRGIVREVSVHLADGVGAGRDRMTQAVDIREAQPARALAMEHLDAAVRLACERVGDLARCRQATRRRRPAVGRTRAEGSGRRLVRDSAARYRLAARRAGSSRGCSPARGCPLSGDRDHRGPQDVVAHDVPGRIDADDLAGRARRRPPESWPRPRAALGRRRCRADRRA